MQSKIKTIRPDYCGNKYRIVYRLKGDSGPGVVWLTDFDSKNDPRMLEVYDYLKAKRYIAEVQIQKIRASYVSFKSSLK